MSTKGIMVVGTKAAVLWMDGNFANLLPIILESIEKKKLVYYRDVITGPRLQYTKTFASVQVFLRHKRKNMRVKAYGVEDNAVVPYEFLQQPEVKEIADTVTHDPWLTREETKTKVISLVKQLIVKDRQNSIVLAYLLSVEDEVGLTREEMNKR